MLDLNRRSFLASLGAGLTLAVATRAGAVTLYPTGADQMPGGTVSDPLILISLAEDGTTTIVSTRPDMGTGIRTSLPLLVAEEMEADWTRVRLVQAPGDEARYGSQNVDGSRSIKHFIQPMRVAGDAMRRMLEQAAANRWGVPIGQARAEAHRVLRLDGSGAPTGEALEFGALAVEAAALAVPATETLTLKTRDQFRYVGKDRLPVWDHPDIVQGRASYGADIRLPGMVFAVVARPPVVGGRVASFDDAAARAVPGFVATHRLPDAGTPVFMGPLGGVAVVARSTWAAMQAREALAVTWDNGPNASYDTPAYEAALIDTVSRPAQPVRRAGDAEAALSGAARVVEATYTTAHVSHSTMEPPAAVASVTAEGAEIWAPVQNPQGARDAIAQALGLDPAQVRVNVTLLGGGFGRKSKPDFAVEAALVSQAVGAPVLLQWTREDDIRHDFYHGTSAQRLTAALDDAGRVTGWRHRVAAPTILSLFQPGAAALAGFEQGQGLIDTPFAIPNLSIEVGEAPAHVRIGWYRAVSNLYHAFAVQSFAAELAEAAGRDPVEMLRDLIGPARIIDPTEFGLEAATSGYGEPAGTFPIDTGRMRAVLDRVAALAEWGRDLPPGEGLGVALHGSFSSIVGTVAHVRVTDGQLTIPAIFSVIDCGFCVNPDRVRAQLEGASVMGVSLALHERISFAGGVPEQSNFYDAPIARMADRAQVVTVEIMPHGPEVPAGGVGEPPLPPIAPALANAIARATGQRPRSLPFPPLA